MLKGQIYMYLSVFGDTEMTAWTYSKRVRGGLESEHLDVMARGTNTGTTEIRRMRVGNR